MVHITPQPLDSKQPPSPPFSPQEVVLAATEGWQQLDSINLTSTFHRLAQLAEGSPAGTTAVRGEVQACGVWAWLLDCLAAAAQQDPEFGPRCIANALWALHKLDALDCARLEALRAPLARALVATAAGSGAPQTRLSARGLTQVLGVLGAEPGTQPLLAALKPQLLHALWVAAPTLDAQGISTAWHALGCISVRSSPGEAQLGGGPPELLPRLAAAARAVAPSMTFQGLAEVLHACTKMQPQPYRDDALLQALCSAATRRLQGGSERPSPQAVGMMVLALGRLGYRPPCQWDSQSGTYVNVLDGLLAELVNALPQASPQEICSCMSGLGLLAYMPQPLALCKLLTHLAWTHLAPAPEAAAQQRLPQPASSASNSSNGGGPADGAAAAAAAAQEAQQGGAAPAGRRQGARLQLELEKYSCAELVELLGSLRRILQSGHYTPDLLPPVVLNSFLDAFDTLMGARARMALRITASPQLRQAPQRAELALTPAHVSALCWALAGIPGATLTAETLRALERHLAAFAPSYSGSALANLLNACAQSDALLSAEAVAALEARALEILSQQVAAAQQAQWGQQALAPPQGFTLGAGTKLLFAVTALGLALPRLLCTLLPAVAAAMDEHDRAAQAGGLPSSTARHLVRLAVALGSLQVSGQLAAAGISHQAQLLPLWRQAMALLDVAASCSMEAGGPPVGLAQQDARACLRAAGQLNMGLAGGRAVFFVPAAVQRAVA
ncbi:CLR family protein [Chlorella sorokiniana]|uniref:CLR family protein n=1 Tax=Chlorella sorokiniana TaxID=3076 RepID=A0A2P6TXE0_CHLSO|nr:CLR family protein [Chlorella sorokiniana]|eukprot:PRW58721.1 CLR family protein [Chlorella sorokiniana]